MRNSGKSALVLLVVVALLLSQMASIRQALFSTGAHAASSSAQSASKSAAVQNVANVATSTIVPATALSINPSNGSPGTVISLTGPTGALPASDPVSIYFHDPLPANPAVLIGTGATNTVGQLFVGGLKLPSSATPGNATIIAVAQVGGGVLTGNFAVNTTLIVTPTATFTGSVILVTGEAYAPFNTISFTLNGTAITPLTPPIAADHLGHFSASFSVPTTLGLGVAVILATDGVHSASASFAVGTGPTATPIATTTATVTATASAVAGTPTFLPTAPPLHRSPTPIPTTNTGGATPVPGSQATRAYFAEGYTGTSHVNGRADFSEIIAVLNPNSAPAAVTFTYYIQGKAAPVTVTRTIQASSALRESVNADLGPDALVSAVVTSPQKVYAVRTITRTSPTGSRLDGSTTQPAGSPATAWNFAEGYTGVTFQEYLTILNPSNAAAQVTIKLAPQAASAANARTLTLSVPPLSRATANIRALNSGKGSASVGMVISSNQPIVAERVEYFGDGNGSGKFGSTVSAGLPSAASQLRIGFGASGGSAADSSGKTQPIGDQEFITLLNAASSGAAAHVTVAFADAAGHTLGQPVVVDVAAGTRNTVIANPAIGSVAAGPFSVSLNASSGTIQAEAAQYFGGSPNIGKHPGIALAAGSTPATDLFLADLATQLPGSAAVNRTVYLYNPNSTAIQVNATYYNAGGLTAQTTYTVSAGGITAASVNHDAPLAFGSGAIGAEFKSTSGSFTAYAIGRTADGLAALEEIGSPAS